MTDADGRTSVAGVWVAGNVANPRAQVITAAGEGSAAAIAINADLVETTSTHPLDHGARDDDRSDVHTDQEHHDRPTRTHPRPRASTSSR